MTRIRTLFASALALQIVAPSWALATPRPVVNGTDLALVIALARACVLLPPYDGKGTGKLALDLTPIGLGRSADRATWGVNFVERDPSSRPAVHVEIDVVARTCNGKRVIAEPSASHVVDIDAVVAGARRCASGTPWFGHGVSGGALDLAAWSVGYRPYDGGMLVTFPEVKPSGAPSGLDLEISFDGRSCHSVWMDRAARALARHDLPDRAAACPALSAEPRDRGDLSPSAAGASQGARS
jgi:hypothetical protein